MVPRARGAQGEDHDDHGEEPPAGGDERVEGQQRGAGGAGGAVDRLGGLGLGVGYGEGQ